MFEYNRNLNIAVFTEDSMLKQLISKTKSDKLHISLSEYTDFNEISEDVSVIIFDVGKLKASELRKKYTDRVYLILLADDAAAESLDDSELDAVEDIWNTHMGEKFAKKKLEALINEIATLRERNMAKKCLDSAIDTLPDMLWFKAIDGTHTKVNQAFCNIVGKTREDVTGKDHCYVWNVSREEFSKGVDVCKESEDYVIKERRTCQFVEKVKSRQGMRQFKTYKSPVFDDDGTILGTVGIGHDVTVLENLGAELEIVLSSMPYAILLSDKTGKIIDVNQKFEEYFQIGKENVIGMSYEAWLKDAFEGQSTVNKEGYPEAVTRLSKHTFEIYDEPIVDVFRNVVGELCIYKDVTKIRALESQIVHSANTDFLTGLNNRRSFYNYINNNRGTGSVSLLYMDLDNFKKLNDTYGHKAGDEALVKVSNILKEHFSDDFIARFGGDEFVVAILEPRTVEDLKKTVEKLQNKMMHEFGNSEKMNILTLSVGISQTNDTCLDIDTLINQGDTALYEVKQTCRGKYCVYSEMTN